MDHKELLQAAIEARKSAYIPYSHFGVGAALQDATGHVHHGCNVENAALGPTNCAERTALFRAIADGCAPHSFTALAVVGDTKDPIAPCGVCRQVILELCAPDMPVILGNLKGDMKVVTVSDLLPHAFAPEHLNS